MNKILTVLTAVLISANLWAQAPQSFSYQAVIRGGNNVLVANKPVGMKISLLQGSEKGKAVYVETHKPTSNDNGLVSIAIGGGTKDASSTAFASIDWSKGPYFVQTETDPAGGTNYSLSSVSQLLSVPYAIHSKTAESIVGGNSGNNTGSFSHYIGEEFGGGFVFHLWKDKLGVEHGLVVDKTDLSISQAWSNVTDVAIGEAASSRWDGLSNSNAIVNQQGHSISAAKLCLDLFRGGYDDWYLPSIEELSLLCRNKYSLIKINNGKDFLNSFGYKSSTEESSTNCWYFEFLQGVAKSGDSPKTDASAPVRAIRAF